MMRIVVLCAVLASCDPEPSVLDDVGRGIDPAMLTWRTIEDRAAPMSARLDLLRAAIRGPRTTPAELEQRAAELVAWMDAGGSVPPPPLFSALNDIGVDGILGLVREGVTARPTDDRFFEAALYAAAKLRRDGTGFLAGMIAGAIVSQLVKQRPTPPSFAASYAPTDAEVYRLFASEAMFARRATFEIGRDDGTVAFHQQLAAAPMERAAFLAILQRLAADSPYGSIYVAQARRLFGDVDAYRTWLGG